MRDVSTALGAGMMGTALDADTIRAPSGEGQADARSSARGPENCGRLVINEVQTSGRSAATDEFVELFNAGTCPIVLDHWSLQYLPASGQGGYHYWRPSSAGLRVEQGKYFVIANKGYSGTVKDEETTARGLAERGSLALFFDEARIDSIAWGAVPAGHGYVEAAVAMAPQKGRSIARSADGVDTDRNADDFRPTAPTPGASNGARP
jgi:hypothetical protein